MVVELNAYYDFEHGKEPARVTSEEQLAAILEEVRRTRKAALVELLPADNPAAATLDVGFCEDRGVVWYSGPDHESCYSHNPTPTPPARRSRSCTTT
ncbi:Imm1 family immunity protein [Allokutzneria albata]|uniref:Immunity protein Imm1 n=1 Tax=Allokutzneria albata TaxID=211114 RepID=A0A1G9QUG2_ALLAB|nr:Imm1 family immunity protein [Allokutzneria albata]SDM14583.1 Immunity protein Imm1 [Allokutzneria albata]